MTVRLFARSGRWLALAALVFVLAACAGTNRQVVEPGYQTKLTSRPTLLILPLSGDLAPLTARPGTDADPPLTFRDRTLFYRFFGGLIADVTLARVLDPDPTFRPDSVGFVFERLPLDEGDAVEVLLLDGGRVRTPTEVPAFLLLVDDLYFSFGADEGQQGPSPVADSRLTLYGGFEYVLWDNRVGQRVGYGRLRRKVPILERPTREAYLALLEALAIDVIRQSPFPYRDRGPAG